MKLSASEDKLQSAQHTLTHTLMEGALKNPPFPRRAQAVSNKQGSRLQNVKIARMTLTIKLDGNWSGFQLANNTKRLPSKKKQSEDLALESSRRRSPPEARRTLPPARLSFDSWASTRSGCGGRVANAAESSARRVAFLVGLVRASNRWFSVAQPRASLMFRLSCFLRLGSSGCGLTRLCCNFGCAFKRPLLFLRNNPPGCDHSVVLAVAATPAAILPDVSETDLQKCLAL